MRSIFHDWVFWLVAAPWAIFYGFFCFTIFLWSKKSDYDLETGQIKEFKTLQELKKKKWPWILHQFWFNALGVFIGWMVIFYALEGNVAPTDKKGLFLWIVGFIGITGHLPFATIELIKSLAGGLKEWALKEKAKKDKALAEKALEEIKILKEKAAGGTQS